MQKEPGTDKWETVNIPAILDEESAILLREAQDRLITQGFLPKNAPPIEVGGSYWPVLPENVEADVGLRGWFLDELHSARDNMPPYQWSALYMQNPVPEEGGILKRDWWQEWKEDRPPPCDYILQSWDTAFSTKNTSDYSAITTWGIFRDKKDIPNMILLGGQRGRWEYPELRMKSMELYNFHEPDSVIIEKAASGQSLIQDLSEAGLPIIPYTPDKDKVSRAHACTPLLSSGRIWIPRNKNWAGEVVNECANFPNAANDDYTDTVTQAILWLKGGRWVRHPDDWEEPDYRPKRKNRNFY
jgi:predicted phage terminase large subunit-like protein